MYVHVERKDYKCGECGKLFKRLGHVQQHLRSHSQERTFRCTECDKLFKTQVNKYMCGCELGLRGRERERQTHTLQYNYQIKSHVFFHSN